MDGFVACLDAADQHWFQQNGSVFVELLDAVAEGARHHHDEIVAKFISDPAANAEGEHLERVTASDHRSTCSSPRSNDFEISASLLREMTFQRATMTSWL